ncbi:MAGUK p55 subfamily member 7-like isoform X4 [Haliotis rufescens]|uniref:MAGUK p55 subfamily member 7-like isoform X4 n=1 Tax=Haliotis rufescens TaxID=6454 RepID=UPI00201F862D|nr:MAGUK p55 subfamily member 7-like isoform X4 [Haliotis rufescens]
MPITLPLTKVAVDPDAQKLLTALPSLETRLPSKGPEIAFLRRFLRSRDLRLLLHVYRLLSTNQQVRPVAEFAVSQAADVFCSIRCQEEDLRVQELLDILSKPHLQALLYTHDKISRSDYSPQVGPLAEEVDEDEAAVKVVRLIKSNEPLGVTIQLNEDSGNIEVARVLHGGAADRSGLIHVGDEVHEVNGVCVRGCDPNEVVDILSRITGPVTLKLVPSNSKNGPDQRQCQMRVKALFDYTPETDTTNPCPEAGLEFRRGDVLHIVNQDDPTWWQARKEGETITSAGLIPSKQLQERNEMQRRADAKGSPGQVRNGTKYDTEEIPTYEEVEQYQPKPNKRRPIVLIGPAGVGCNELKRRLKASNPVHFLEAVPYTSRPKKPFEQDGKEYHFVTREEMESGIMEQRSVADEAGHSSKVMFAEFGEYKGNLYGTSVESIKTIIALGKVCLVTPHTQALKFLRQADIKPYIIFIKPPSLEMLQATRGAMKARVTKDGDVTQPFTVRLSQDELQAMVESSDKIEERFGHLFDYVIVNDNISNASADLIRTAARIESEPHWVPIGWSAQ